MNHTGATQTTGVGAYAGPVATVAAYSSGDSLSSRLIASRTSAPPSVAFAPWGEVRETVCPRNINNEVLSHFFFRNIWPARFSAKASNIDALKNIN